MDIPFVLVILIYSRKNKKLRAYQFDKTLNFRIAQNIIAANYVWEMTWIEMKRWRTRPNQT